MLRNIYTTATLITTIIAAAIATTPPTAKAQTIWYVDDDAYGYNTGQSWQDAFADLQDALDAATNGHEIHVAAGTYYPSKRSDPQDPRSASFQLINGVSLKGGYAGLSEPQAPDTRDTTLYESTISGDLNQNDGPILMQHFVADLATQEDPDRHEFVLFLNANNYHDNAYHIFYHSSDLALDNTAVLDGFTITAACADHDDADLIENGGGGICNNACSPKITNCKFLGNTARQGGALYNHNNSSPSVTNCIFSENVAYQQTTHFYHYGGAVSNAESSNPQFANCIFRRNAAGYYGGGIYDLDNSSPTVVNCLFVANLLVPYSRGSGGGIYNLDGAPTINNCTFYAHRAEWGAGAGCGSAASVRNCILWSPNTEPGNQHQLGISWPYDAFVAFCWVAPQTPNDALPYGDPLFVDADGPDMIPGTEDDDLRLQPDSPCINAGGTDITGLPNHDIDGNPRVQQCRVDIGAYETSYPGPDCNSNGIADACDILDGTSDDTNSNGIPDTCDVPTIYVDHDAPGDNTGQSWQDAFTDLQDALDVATNGDTILVAQGTYIPSHLTEPDDPRTATFILPPGVAVLGGYVGFGAANPYERNTSQYDTRLSGNVDSSGDYTTNCYHIVCHYADPNVEQRAVLDGLIFQASLANGDYPHDRGSAIYTAGADPLIIDCTFDRSFSYAPTYDAVFNDAGNPVVIGCRFSDSGGISSHSGNPTIRFCDFQYCFYCICNNNSQGVIEDCTFYHCQTSIYNYQSSPSFTNCTFTEYRDYGMHNEESSNPVVTNCMFGNSDMEYSGKIGMYNEHSSPWVEDCTFRNNEGQGMRNEDGDPTVYNCTFCNNGLQGMRNEGGAPTVYNCTFENNQFHGMMNRTSSPTVIGCNFFDNVAFGGGAVAYGGGIWAYCGSIYVADCLFHGNTSSEGGAIAHEYAEATIQRCTFIGNSGALRVDRSSRPTTVTDCLFVGNSTPRRQAAITAEFGDIEIVNCAITGTNDQSGCAIFAEISPRIEITNSILWNGPAQHDTQIVTDSRSGYFTTVTISNSLIQGGLDSVLLDEGDTLNWGTGNIDLDPLFVRNPNAGTNGWDGSDDDYGDLHLTYRSPCIEAGNTDALPPDTNDINSNGDIAEPIPFDLDDNPRIIGCNVDIGPYEYQTNPILRGDYNADCYIDLDDYSYFQPCLTDSGPNTIPNQPDCTTIFDFNNDNDIDLHDFQTFQLSFSP